MNIEKGKYWDVAVNPIVHDKCSCEVGDRCWAKKMLHMRRNLKGWQPGYYFKRLNNIPLTGKSRVFAFNWLCDIAHSSVPKDKITSVLTNLSVTNEHRVKHWGLQPHIFLILSKFPHRLFDAINNSFKQEGYWKDGLWIGTSISGADNTNDFNRLWVISKFKDIGFKTWLSYEPILNPVSKDFNMLRGMFDQIIAGAETGSGARPCNLDWIRTIRDECANANVPFFLKQIDKDRRRLLDGRTHDDLAWRK
ncbi:MAG: DUF5131 family protein, partial [Candidatus Hodarchaeota archaeon]